MWTPVQRVQRRPSRRAPGAWRAVHTAVSASRWFLRSCAGTAVTLAVLSAGCAESTPKSGNGGAASTAIERTKADRLAREQQTARTVPTLASIKVDQPRPLTLRDSGQSGTLAFLREVDFRIVGDLGFLVHELSATLVPTHPGAPTVFDDPTSFDIAVHRGTVTLDNTKLNALFGGYIFGYRNAPLRNVRVSAGDGFLDIRGEMQRDGWVPFALKGKLEIRDGSTLVFHPTDVHVSGIEAGPVMRAAKVQVSDLLKIDTPIVRLNGNDLVLNVDKLLPPPHLKINIVSLKLTSAGLDLVLDDGTKAGFTMPENAPKHAMYLRGGDVKFMRTMPMNADIVIYPPRESSPDDAFVFDMYHYRDQLVAGYFNFEPSGALSILMPSYRRLARPSAPSLGSAAARMNDSLIDAQQLSLGEARRQWEAFAITPNGGAAQLNFRKVAAKHGGDVSMFGPRHISNGTTTIHLHNADFYIAGNIGFRVEDLVVQLVSKRAGEPVDLDDPNQYDIRILSGSVLAPWNAMSDLFNRHLLDYSPRSLNDLKLSADGGALRVRGGIKLWNQVPPGVWLPADMKGSLTLLDERHLAFTPTQVSVLGIPQAKLLRALGIELSSLAPLKRRGAELRGDSLVLDQYTVFPPPVLIGHMSQATVEPDGLRLTFRPAPNAPVLRPPANLPGSYLWLEGGDTKMFNVLVLNMRILVEDTAKPRVRFDLYDYRDVVSRGSVRMVHDGTLYVDVGKKDPLAR